MLPVSPAVEGEGKWKYIIDKRRSMQAKSLTPAKASDPPPPHTHTHTHTQSARGWPRLAVMHCNEIIMIYR